ncbi:hypothetical protein QBC47DRAFT_398000 [Echria macrotheca]|uniref:Uncharacterized protein n=1 Tax=Echria macrotheca TaxID=438768 RepID=A0AAJ0BJ26_9PEZI|nr:hypothetical protein QBC47DRAFT_398000 [Echria macrotheca]
MGRQLPWKVDRAPILKQNGSPLPSRNPAPAQGPTKSKSESTPKPRRSLVTPARSPSTSPPPEPLKEEFMVEGVDHDDKYRMVEDEFLSVAHDFTRHLHAAEYQRLKNLAKTQNAKTIQNISRPVTGEMTDLVKRRHAALDTAARQRRGLSSVLGKRTESDDLRASSLQGLMDSPRKKAAPISLASFTSAMRSPSKPKIEFDSEDDDLDGPSIVSRLQLPLINPQSRSTTLRSGTDPSPTLAERHKPTAAERSQLKIAKASSRPTRAQADEEDEDDLIARIRSRREEQKRRRESGKIKLEEDDTLLDEIPFMQ